MIKTHWPVLFLLIFWVSFSFPFFFQNKVPYPSTHQVNAFSPWSRYSQYASPVKNDAMPDIIDQIYPWKHFAIEQIKTGNLPLWNPYSFSGTPHVANFQSAVFSPFTILYFIFSFADAWSLIVLLQPLLAGLFTYIYMQKISVSKTGCLLSAITFMFSGFMVVWMAYGTLGMAIAFLPLMLYCIEKFFEKKSFLPLLGISFGAATSFFSGHFQTSLYMFGTSMLYLIWKIFLTKNRLAGGWVGLYLILGLFLALPQLLPSFEFYHYAPRSSSFAGSSGIPFVNIVTSIAPDFFGNPVTRNNLFMDYAEWQTFIGVVPLLLSFFAFSFLKKKSITQFFMVMGLLSLLFSLASPIQNIISFLHIPVLSTSTQSRIIILFSFCFAVLAGVGFDVLQKSIKEKKKAAILIRLGIVAFLVAGVWITLFVGNFLSAEYTQIAKKNFILPTLFLFATSGIVLVSLYFKNKYIVYLLAIVLVGLTTFDSFRFATKWIPFDPKSLVFPEEKITSVIQKELKQGRVFGNIGQEMTMFYHLPTVGGYDPLYIQRYGEFIASATTGTFTHSGGRTVFLDKTTNNADKVLNLLGITTIIHPIADTNAVWAYPVWNKEHMKQVYTDEAYALYKNEDAPPRAKMFYQYETITQKEKLIEAFYNQTFDYTNTLLVEENIQIKLSKDTSNTVSFLSDEPNKIILAVDTKENGLLFLSDTYYPGWKAYVNEKEAKIYRADYAFRTIIVPKGKHTVIFKYEPQSFMLGVLLAGFGLLGLTAYPFFHKALKRS